MRKKSLLGFIWAFCLGVSSLLGQASFRVFSDTEGLPQRTVNAMTVDRQGRIWAGTQAGVAWYDGQHWNLAKPPVAAQSLFVNPNAMTTLSDGRVWIGSRFQGVLEFGPGGWKTFDQNNGLPSENVNAILESHEKDPNGQPKVWVATYGKGLARWSEGRWTTFGAAEGLGDERLFCLLENRDESGRWQLLAGSNRGVWVFDGARWRPFAGNPQLLDPRVRALAETQDPDGQPRLWLGLEQGGLMAWKGGRLEPAPVERLSGSAKVRALLADPATGGQGLWVALMGGGVLHHLEGAWETLNKTQGLPSDLIRSLAVSPGGRAGQVLWVGTESQGLVRYPGAGWCKVPSPWKEGDPRVQCFWDLPVPITQRPTLWAGNMTQGLGSLHQGKWTLLDRRHGFPADSVRAFFSFPNRDELFFGTFQGLGSLKRGQVHLYTPKDGLPEAQVRALAGTEIPGGQRILWIGTSRGLVSWDGAHFQPVPAPPNDPEASIRALKTSGERLWVGTDKGLACLVEGRWVSFPFLQKLAGTQVRSLSLQRDSAGRERLWIGTYSKGLFIVPDLLRPDLVAHLSAGTEPALPHDLISAIAEGPEGWVFATTPRGAFRVRPQGDSFELDTFTRQDGLPALECLDGALYRDHSGRMWLGTTDGVAYLDNPGFPADRVPKLLNWAEAKVQDRTLAPGAALGHREQGLRFSFRLLSQHREEDSRFQTQLVGLQAAPEPWSPATEVRFPTLPAGKYVLKVWGKDYAGNISHPLAFPFTVKVAPWWSAWAILLYFLAAAAGVLGLLRLRTRYLAEKNRALEARIAAATEEIRRQKQDLEVLNQDKNRFMGIAAHDLKNPLNAIMLTCEGLISGDIETCPEPILYWLKRIDHASRTMASIILEFLDINAIDSGRMAPELRPVNVGEILDSAIQANGPKAEDKEQKIVLETTADLQALADPRHLLQILDNLISNAIKFSPIGARITVSARTSEDRTVFCVKDEGPGLTAADREGLFKRFTRLSAQPTAGEHSSGLGLSIAHQLAEAMGGRIWAESEPGQGACFLVELRRS